MIGRAWVALYGRTTTAASDRTIGENVRMGRESRGMTQAQLAARIAMSGLAHWYSSTVAKVEQGTRALKFSEAMVIANILSCDVKELAR